MDRITNMLFAFFAVMFASVTAQAKPGLPPDGELLSADCGLRGENCPSADGSTIQAGIEKRGLTATPERVALMTNTRTGECPNLVSGAVWMICTLSNGSKLWVDPVDYKLRTVAQVRALDERLDCRRTEFGLNRRHGARLTVFQSLPPCQGGRQVCEAYVAGLERQVRALPAGGTANAQSAPGRDEEVAALQAALQQQGRELAALRAAPNGITSGQVVFLSVVLMVFGTVLWFLWRQRHRANAALQETRASLRLAQDAHSSLLQMYKPLLERVGRARQSLNASEFEGIDDAAEGVRRGLYAAVGADYREAPSELDVVKVVADKIADLKKAGGDLVVQIRRTRGALRAPEDLGLAQAAQTRMDELQAQQRRAEQAEVARADLLVQVQAALGELGAHEAEASEIAVLARQVVNERDHASQELALAQGEMTRLTQEAAEARAAAEDKRQHALRAEAELSGLRGRVNGFAAVTERIAANLDGLTYFYDHPCARQRKRVDGTMQDTPRRAQFGAVVQALRTVFPAPPPEPKTPPARGRRGRRAASTAAVAPV
ncbi:hypothetical protein HYW17_02055 [Candidatus Uhrbacteria bacterium]|nr:hypothetical protein [Candidatus Uhrbacteria bacterium]